MICLSFAFHFITSQSACTCVSVFRSLNVQWIYFNVLLVLNKILTFEILNNSTFLFRERGLQYSHNYSLWWLDCFCCRIFQITNLMHNSFILQQYVCYITILNMFRAAPCSSSGGQILLLQPLVSSLSVNSRTVCRWRADCSPLSTCILYGCLQRVTIPEAVVIQFVLLRMSRVLLETCWGS